jgi:hypothetical protein
MKNRIIISILLLAAIFTACEKENEAPHLTVAINPAQVVNTINDTLVVYAGQELEFQLSGNANLLTFYSGEAGRAYANRNRIAASGTPKMDVSYAPNRVTVDNKVDILASTNLTGIIDSTNIRAAKWDTITPADLKAYLNNATAKPISTIDLSKYGAGLPVYIAFRLVINSAARFVAPTFSNLLIRNYQDDGVVSSVAANFTEAGMSFVTMSENAKWKATGSGNALWKLSSNTITVNTAVFDAATVNPVYNATDGRIHEMWAVSKVLYLNSTLPDAGVTIKDIQKAIANYKYTYKTAGIYTVTFVASNADYTGVTGSDVKNLIIKVIAKV